MFISTYVAVSEFVYRLRRNTSGVTAIEYGLIAGAIAVAIITTVTTLGTDIAGKFSAVSTALTPATN
ncbi:MAG TPA: Flp family type IVb pilin [Alphaproteobacteria bacterium]